MSRDFLKEGNDFMNAKNYEDAIKCYDKAIELNPDYADAYNSKGIVLEKMQKYEDAIKCYDKAIELNPNYAIAYNNKGIVLSTIQKHEDAIKCYDKAIELNPNYAAAYNNKGFVLQEMQKSEDAIKCYDKAIELDPNYAAAYNNKGIVLETNQKYEDAIKCYDKTIELDPNGPAAYNNKGVVLEEMQKYEDAIKCYDKAIELNPNDESAYNNKGSVLETMQKYEDAIKWYDKAIELNPDDAGVYYNKGIVSKAMQKYEDAIKWYDKAIELNPNYAAAYNNKGIVLKAMQKYEDAIKCYDKAIKLNPNSALYYCNRGVVYHSLNIYNKALEDFDQASYLISQPSRGSNNLHKGHLHYIENTMTIDRQEVISKITKLEKELIQVESRANKLDLSIPAVKDFIKILLKNKEAQKSLTNKALNSIDVKSQKNTIETDLLDKLAQQDIINKQLLEQFNQLEKQLKDTNQEVKTVKQVLKDASIYDKALIKQEFEAFKKESPQLYDYCKTFYWTLLNYLNAYRTLSTGLIEGNKDALTEKESFFLKGIKGMFKIGSAIAEGVPFAGGILSGIDRIVDSACNFVNERRFEHHMNIITKYIIESNETEEDLSLRVAKASIEITKAKTKEILDPQINSASQSPAIVKGLKWIANKVEQMVEDFKQKTSAVTSLYDTPTKELALQDVILFLTYIYSQQEFIPCGVPMEDVIKTIVTTGCFNTVLIEIEKQQEQEPTISQLSSPDGKKTNRKKKTEVCCRIF